MTSAYLSGMLSRLVTMLAVLAIAVMTTVTAGHAALLGAEPDHAVHVSKTMQVDAGHPEPCDGERHCGSGDVASCELLCAGVSVFLTSPNEGSGGDCASAGHDLPAAENLASRAPGLNERPPKLRLL
ncbi:hypothetical protein [Neotabrizicola sp. VNH66]|uniref:hypothetical protein n=1 Tax=Neotabrizicola sp. VNH66 TaxID=3400918 RepID=UPI003C0B57EA